MVLKSVIIGGLFVVGIAFALFTYVYPYSGGSNSNPTPGSNNNGETNTTPPILTSPPSSGIDTEQTAKLIHQYVNEERTKAGLPALTWNDHIAALAISHDQDMLARNYYEHDSPDGKTLEDRAAAANVCARGENLNQIGSDYGDRSTEQAAQNTIKSWMESPLHRQNILGTMYTQEGIGVVLDSSGRTGYVTQDFC